MTFKNKKIFILGANGFIGSYLIEYLLEKTDFFITGLDIYDHYLKPYISNTRYKKRFCFKKGDLYKETDWIETQIAQHDVVFPLAAIATPATYVSDPLRIFALDFEANLAIIRLCVKHQKRVIFPSTSEVYGMCPDEIFDEETSLLVTGPVQKERWIYACSKQMLDRIIYAYGKRHQLSYTLFRPFNWIGARLDDVANPKRGGSRVITQFIGNILRHEPILLCNDGIQKRCLTDIDDGIDALLKIIENKNNSAENQIFNLGNPSNHLSIRSLAEKLLDLIKENYPAYKTQAENTPLIAVKGEDYFGEGYQDVENRKPSIKRAQALLGWTPRIDTETALKKILAHHLA